MYINSTDRHKNGFIAAVINWSVSNKILVCIAAITLLVAGSISLLRIPLDAIPDLSDTQVIIRTDWPGQAPQVIEDQITFPLSSQMLGLPKTKAVRGFSMFGSSFVYTIFEDGTDMYWARSRVLEALSQAQSTLPPSITPQLGPDATGVGWVFQYALYDRTERHDLSVLRSLQDWFIRFELATIDGVSEVASVGGFKKEYQIQIDPNKLRAYDVALKDVIKTAQSASEETSGRTIEMGETEFLIRALGHIQNTQDIEKAVIKSVQGTPITIGHVARVIEGPAFRRGITELNGVGEAVGGIVVMRAGENAMNVIRDVKIRLEQIKQGLPDGVEIKVVYDRSQLIGGAIAYLKEKLIEESLIVALITFLFLLHVRSALVAILTIPLGILSAFILMNIQGVSANIMSLGGIAIAIGAMVDASIVMVENAHRRLAALDENADNKEKQVIIIHAAKEVGPGLFFSLLIITASFIPVFFLSGQSAKLFLPLAYTKTYAMAAAAILSITIIPVLMVWLIRGKIKQEDHNPLNRIFIALYRPILNIALKWRKTTVLLALIALFSTAFPLTKLGSEFMPPLYEGGLLYMPMTLPGVSATKAREALQITNRQIMTIPEVEHVFGKAGRADTATDPAPLTMIETWIELKPKDQWRTGMTPEKLIDEMNKHIGIPGMMNSWGYPIKIRLDMLTTGIRTPIGVKIAGSDLSVIDGIAKKTENLIREIDGTRNVIADRVVGGKYVEITPNRHEIARYGVSVQQVQNVIQTALGGMALDTVIDGRERYPITVRYARPYRDHLESLNNILVSNTQNMHIPLADLADIKITEGPSIIKSEDARLNGWVFVDIDQSDIGGYIKALRHTLNTVDLPQGYTYQISGQYEQMQEARQRLSVAIPATILIIFVLLYLYFNQWDKTWLVMASIPFGLIGGFWCVWLAGYNLSVAVAVGFIALAGIAVETVIVMLLYIEQEMQQNKPSSTQAIIDNVRRGALLRLRPKLMTVSTIILGLIPIFLTAGPGADIMRRIALPMVGGMVSTLLLTLILVPVLYVIYMQKRITK